MPCIADQSLLSSGKFVQKFKTFLAQELLKIKHMKKYLKLEIRINEHFIMCSISFVSFCSMFFFGFFLVTSFFLASLNATYWIPTVLMKIKMSRIQWSEVWIFLCINFEVFCFLTSTHSKQNKICKFGYICNNTFSLLLSNIWKNKRCKILYLL